MGKERKIETKRETARKDVGPISTPPPQTQCGSITSTI